MLLVRDLGDLRELYESYGVLDPALSLDLQMTIMSRAAFYKLWVICQGQKADLAIVIHAFVPSRLAYRNAIYRLPLKTIQKCQVVLNAAARLLPGTIGNIIPMIL